MPHAKIAKDAKENSSMLPLHLSASKSSTVAMNDLTTAKMGRKERKKTKESRQTAAIMFTFSVLFRFFRLIMVFAALPRCGLGDLRVRPTRSIELPNRETHGVSQCQLF
jgi:hypothetical protein